MEARCSTRNVECQRPSMHQRRLPLFARLQWIHCHCARPHRRPRVFGSSDRSTSSRGPVTSARALSNAVLKSQKEIIEAIGQLTAEVRNVTNEFVGHLLCNKISKKMVLPVHKRCITCSRNTTALGAWSSFAACASISSGSNMGAGAGILFLCVMLCKNGTCPDNMAKPFQVYIKVFLRTCQGTFIGISNSQRRTQPPPDRAH